MVKQAMLFDSPQHGFSSFSCRLQIESLYFQSLLVQELKLPVEKIQLFTVTKSCTPTQAATRENVVC